MREWREKGIFPYKGSGLEKSVGDGGHGQLEMSSLFHSLWGTDGSVGPNLFFPGQVYKSSNQTISVSSPSSLYHLSGALGYQLPGYLHRPLGIWGKSMGPQLLPEISTQIKGIAPYHNFHPGRGLLDCLY